MEQVGSVPVSDSLRSELAESIARERAWELALEVSAEAKEAGCAGVIVTGLKFDTVVDEASRSGEVSRAERPLSQPSQAAQRTPDGRSVGRVVLVIPLLVEYSEDDDTGCAFGAIVMIGVVGGGLLLLRLATTRTRR